MGPPPEAEPSALRIVEVVSSNDGVAVDELGETDDYVELRNLGASAVSLAGYALTDRKGKRSALPSAELAPGAVVLLWADNQPEQGPHHLTLKLDADGEQLTLSNARGMVDAVEIPALEPNEVYLRTAAGEFVRCRYASPGKASDVCALPAPDTKREDVTFTPYSFPESFPSAPVPLALNELALRPDAFVEVVNTSQAPVELARFSLLLFATHPSAPKPPPASGAALVWPRDVLGPGERVAVPVSEAQLEALVATSFEGRVALYDTDGKLIDRVPFAAIPDGAALGRFPDQRGTLRLCAPTRDAANGCTPVPQRTVGDRLYQLATDRDFEALAAGGTTQGQAAVKFLVDMEADDLVHLLGSRRWDLHYRFVRELVDLQPPLNRCVAEEAAEFEQGWREFSNRNYATNVVCATSPFPANCRRFLMGTLVRHARGIATVEFASGDVIDAPLMARAFRAVIAATPEPRAWSLRPADDYQISEMRKLEGTLPIVGPDAPFVDLRYQPLTEGHSYGTLRFVPAAELARTPLSPETLLITDDVPNDVPFVAGIITEAFQTPLSHVNVLSQARGAPNMALRGARDHERLRPLLDTLVRLDVGPDDFSVRPATVEEARLFWDERRPRGAPIVPPGDLSVRHVQPLAQHAYGSLSFVGAKAAQFAELYRITAIDPRCMHEPPFAVPAQAFAIPFAHYVDHFVASGAAERLRTARADARFATDPAFRADALSAVREALLQHPVDGALLEEVSEAVRARFGNRRVRFRSSSNVEDLPTFNGAGLHTSTSVELGDADRSVASGLRTVWASLWSQRAYDERESANLDQSAVLMAVLVHEAQRGEAAQGVGISRDLLDLTRDDIYYLNAQIGEATVTNPAPGVTTEELLYTFPPAWEPELRYRSSSSLSGGQPVLTLSDVRKVACALSAVHGHFRTLLDPRRENRAFAMQIEFKFERDHTLVVKQARPQPFGHVELPTDCR